MLAAVHTAFIQPPLLDSSSVCRLMQGTPNAKNASPRHAVNKLLPFAFSKRNGVCSTRWIEHRKLQTDSRWAFPPVR